MVYNSRDPSGFELCGEEEGSCRFARASLDGDRVWMYPEVLNPKRVRFCWADSPLCNLYDAAGLPVGPFEIEVQQ